MSQLYGQIIGNDGTTKWKPIKATQLPDGSYAIAVDTELVLDSGNVSISNIKVGSTNQTTSNLRYLKVEDDGRVVVKANGTSVESTDNSTTTPLGSGAVYTGTFENIEEYSNLAIIVNTDQDSTTDGFIIEWSVDGVNVNAVDKFTIKANAKKILTFGAVAKYFRVRYTNGPTAQSNFLIKTLLKPFGIKPSSHRIVDNDIDPEDDAELVKAVLTGQIGTSDIFKNVSVDSNGRLLVSSLVNNPEESTDLNIQAYSTMSGDVDTTFLIPTGETLNLTIFNAGGQESIEGAVVELWHDPLATGDVNDMTLIDAIFVNGSSGQHSLNAKFVGDGTALIRMRRRNLSGGSKLILGKVEGYF